LLDVCGILFPPDGTISAFDRGWQLGQYSGIAAGAAVQSTSRFEYAAQRQSFEYAVQRQAFEYGASQ
jgi:hypothetical protein